MTADRYDKYFGYRDGEPTTDLDGLQAAINRDVAAERPGPGGVTVFEAEVARVAGRAAAEVVVHSQRARPLAVPSRPRPSWAGVAAVHDRAVEHVVYDTTGAATPNLPFAIGTTWVADLAAAWSTSAMPIVAATAIVEIDGSQGVPAIPTVTVAPDAGSQGGEKQAVYSKAFKVGPATTSVIDSVLFLNWSQQLEQLAPVAAELGRAMQQAAVAAEADRQVGAAIIADGTAAADFAAATAVFDTSRFLPSVLLLPPGQIGATGIPAPADLAALGITPVLAHVDSPVLLGAGAVTGWLTPLQLTALEPSVLGAGRAYAMFGAVAVDPTGVAVIG